MTLLKNILLMSMCLILLSCKKKHITVEGYLVDERTGGHFNPFNNAQVRLFYDQGKGYSTELGTATVGEDGYYKIQLKEKPGKQIRMELYAEGNEPKYMYQQLVLSTKTRHDFIITCRVTLNWLFIKQSTGNIDSLIVTITNSSGNYSTMRPAMSQVLYTNYNLRGEEKNYIATKLYDNGNFITQLDTVYSGCRTSLNDTIYY